MTAVASKPRDDSADRLIWTAGVAAGASLPHWPSLPIWIPALLGATIAWRLGGALFGWRLPNTPARIFLAVSALAAVLAQYHTLNGLQAGTALLVVMVALKYLESRTARDQLVLIIIGYFLVFASLLADHAALMILYLLGFVWFTTVALLQLGRRGCLRPAWDASKQALRLLLQALPVTVILFVLFPRLPGPIWGIAGMNTSGSSGLSDTMSPGDLTELGLSDEIAFRVEFYDRPPGPNQLYWRGPVLSNFNGRTWSTDGPSMRGDMLDNLEFIGEPIDYRVMLEPHGRNWVFALDMPQRWTEDRGIRMESHFQLVRLRRSIGSRFDYELTSYPQYRAREPLSGRQIEYYLRLPQNSNPRTTALGREWREQIGEPREIIRRALNLFRTETFFYTLTPPPLGANPADEFLFRTREGFCEHYSSAFTALMRAAGIPARVVTGYQGGELNTYGNHYVVYQSNAHAWTELWLEDEGWVRVDPTAAVAPDRISSGLSRTSLAGQESRGAIRNLPWVRQAMLVWDAAQVYWSDWVLGYGPETQRDLLESLGIDRPHWAKLVTLAAAAVLLASGLLTVYLSRAYRWRKSKDRAAVLFARFCRKLERTAVGARSATEGPLAYGNRAAAALPASAGSIGTITRAYLKLRYEPGASPPDIDAFARLVRGFKPASAR
jgi:transglutaminase-like putative cysteine protease